MILDDDKFNELPEWLKDKYEKTDEGYQSIDSIKLAKVKSTADNLDSELKGFKSKFDELNDKFTQSEQLKADEIKRARDEALEEATTKGESDKIKEIYEQKMADLEQRSYERGKSEAAQEFKSQSLQKDAESMRAKLAAELAVDSDSQAALEMLLGNMIKPSEDGVTFFDAQGGALSINDINVYKTDVLRKSPMFKHLIKADHTVEGAGNLNGGAVNHQSKNTNAAAQEAKKKGDLNGFLTASLNSNLN